MRKNYIFELLFCAFLALAWSKFGIAEEQNDARKEKDWRSANYDVTDYEEGTKGHLNARISLISTLGDYENVGLIFLQREKDYEGKGFVCNNAIVNGGAYECDQLGIDDKGKPIMEVLTVGPLSSDFCIESEKMWKPKPSHPDAKNPILKANECDKKKWHHCICYEIDHCDLNKQNCVNDHDAHQGEYNAFNPPDNGSGTGGGNNN